VLQWFQFTLLFARQNIFRCFQLSFGYK